MRKKAEAKNAEVEALRDDNSTHAESEAGEQADLFPELNKDDPKHNALLKAAKKYHSEKAKRDTLLKENKSHVDGLMSNVIGLMHEAEIKKFRFGNVTTELSASKEKVIVKIDTDDDGDDDDNSDD